MNSMLLPACTIMAMFFAWWVMRYPRELCRALLFKEKGSLVFSACNWLYLIGFAVAVPWWTKIILISLKAT